MESNREGVKIGVQIFCIEKVLVILTKTCTFYKHS
jgi:hypothetical protein